MREHTRYLIIAILLTALNVVAASYGFATSDASPRAIWSWTIFVLTVPECGTSLANVWIQVFPELVGVLGSRRADWDLIAAEIPAKVQEEGDV